MLTDHNEVVDLTPKVFNSNQQLELESSHKHDKLSLNKVCQASSLLILLLGNVLNGKNTKLKSYIFIMKVQKFPFVTLHVMAFSENYLKYK